MAIGCQQCIICPMYLCLQINELYIQINPRSESPKEMDQDLFASTNEQEVHNYVQQGNAEEQEFDFGGSAMNNNYQSSSNQNIGLTDLEISQAAIKMKQEEDKIMEKLREKSNKEHEDKLKRKEAGRQQLEDFNRKKEEEVIERKKQNQEKQKKLQELNKKLTEEAGWKKVGANVGLKQGENKSQRDTNRMREAMINKRNDQTTN